MLTPASAQTVTVDYATDDNQAVAGADYTAVSGTLTFSPGDTSKTIQVAILDDDFDEVNFERFEIALTNPVNATLLYFGTPPVYHDAIHIEDNDAKPVATLAPVTVDEAAGTMTLTLALSRPSQRGMINYVWAEGRTTIDGTATQGTDYEALALMDEDVMFSVPECPDSGIGCVTEATFDITLKEDATPEPDETIEVNTIDVEFFDSDFVSTQSQSISFTGTIADNDPAAQVTGVTVTPGDAQLAVSWTATPLADGYKVQWKSGTDAYNTTNQAVISSGSTVSHTVSSLTNGTEYTVRVIATRTGIDDGTASAEATGTPSDNSPATVASTAFTNTPADNVYDLGETIEVTITFDRAVDVTGTPRVRIIAVAPHPFALYNATKSTDTALVFEHLVTAALRDDANGIAIGTGGLELNGGTIRNKDTMIDAELTLETTTGANIKAQWVEGFSVTSDPAVPTTGIPVYGPGETLEVSVRFHDAVTVTGEPTLRVRLSVNASRIFSYTGGSGTNTLTFANTVPQVVADSGASILKIRENENTLTGGLRLNEGTITTSADIAVGILHAAQDLTALVLARPPEPQTPVANAATVTIAVEDGTPGTDNFSKLDTTSVPDPADFAVKVSTATAQPPTSVAIAGHEVTLTLASPVPYKATVRTSYSKGATPLKDVYGNEVASLNEEVTTNDSPPPTVSIADATANEGDGAMTFTVSLDTVSARAVEVHYSTTDGSADGSDYTRETETPGPSIRIAAGATEGTFDIALTDDTVAEGDETFTVTITGVADGLVGDGTATGTITDDDTAHITDVSFTNVPSNGEYNLGDVMEITATFSSAIEVTGAAIPYMKTVIINTEEPDRRLPYVASASSATTMVFRKTVTGAIDDNLNGITATGLEPDGAAIVNEGTNIDASIGFATINGPNVRTRWLESLAVTSEPAVPYTTTAIYGPGETVNITATFEEPVVVTGAPQIVILATLGPLLNMPYQSGSGTNELTFSGTVPARSTGGVVQMWVHRNVRDPTRGLSLNGGTIKSVGGVNVNIRHEEQRLPEIVDTAIPEYETGSVSGRTLVMTHSDFGSAGTEVLDPDSAPAPGDFDVQVEGERTPVASVAVVGKTAELTLAYPVGYRQSVTLGYTPGAQPISDLYGNEAEGLDAVSVTNDSPVPSVSIDDAQANEDDGVMRFTVRLDAPSAERTTVRYATIDSGTATPDVDYVHAIEEPTEVAAGAQTGIIEITLIDDDMEEDNETFEVYLIANDGTFIAGIPGRGRGTIVDDENSTATVRFDRAEDSVSEGSTLDIAVRLSAAAAVSTVIPIETETRAGASAADFSGVPASVTFAAGDTVKTFTMSAASDNSPDDGERVVLTFGTLPAGVRLGVPGMTTITITEAEENDLRLADGQANNEGRLEIYHNGEWGTVCDDRFDNPGNVAPQLACQLMGYATGEEISSNGIAPAPNSMPIWLDDLRCRADGVHWPGSPNPPTALSHCFHAGWGLNNCTHDEDVALRCGNIGGQGATGPLTAEFENVPQSHDGASAFTLRIAFSDDVDITPADFRDHALTVSGGTVTQAARVDARDDLWDVTIEPSGDDAVLVLVPQGRACTEAGALCTADGRTLSTGLGLTIQGPQPLTATFQDMPSEHDGTNGFWMQIQFSAALHISFTALRDHALSATGGAVERARRIDGDSALWEIFVQPAGSGAVTVSLASSGACGSAGAICTADGRALANTPSATIQGPQAPVALTASFANVPAEHDGATGFWMRIQFSAPLHISFTALRDHALSATGGAVERARRIDGDSALWEIFVQPEGGEAVTVSLASSGACGSAGAICTADGQALENTPSATIQAPSDPLTASFENAPAEHDGATPFWTNIQFSAPIAASFRTLRDHALTATGGAVTRARRINEDSALWEILVEPSGSGAVTVTLPASPACDDAHAICTADGRALSNTASRTIQGPPGLSVADAEADEGPNVALAFSVRLDRAASGAVTVDYATADGTATAGSDYTAASGALRFAAGETAKTVSVPVLDDAHDEGSETLTLTLSNAAGAHIADGEATGTIENSDPMPQAWLARFGRTAANQAMQAVSDRLSGDSEAEHLRIGGLGGYRRHLPAGMAGAVAPGNLGDAERTHGLGMSADPLSGAMGTAPIAGGSPHSAFGTTSAGAPGAAFGAGSKGGLNGSPGGGFGTGLPQGRSMASMRGGGRVALHLPELAVLLDGSSFRWSPGDATQGEPSRWTAWGRGSATRFNGRDDQVTLGGEVFGAIVGVDLDLGRVLAGLAVSSAYGTGDYRAAESGAAGGIESTLTSVHPYVRASLTERLDAWGMLGYGRGGLQLGLGEDIDPIDTGLESSMGAAGLRGELWSGERFRLAAKSDAMWSSTSSAATAGLTGATGEASRLRVTMEGSGRFAFGGHELSPLLELGARRDAGDAETGYGMELGLGLGYANVDLGLRIEGRGRVLLAHEDDGYREWGASGSVRYEPGTAGRGLRLGLTSSLGTANSGVERLWSLRDARGLAPGMTSTPGSRLSATLGYGFFAPPWRGLATPFFEMDAGAGAGRQRAGLLLQRGSSGPRVELSVERVGGVGGGYAAASNPDGRTRDGTGGGALADGAVRTGPEPHEPEFRLRAPGAEYRYQLRFTMPLGGRPSGTRTDAEAAETDGGAGVDGGEGSRGRPNSSAIE